MVEFGAGSVIMAETAEPELAPAAAASPSPAGGDGATSLMEGADAAAPAEDTTPPTDGATTDCDHASTGPSPDDPLKAHGEGSVLSSHTSLLHITTVPLPPDTAITSPASPSSSATNGAAAEEDSSECFVDSFFHAALIVVGGGLSGLRPSFFAPPFHEGGSPDVAGFGDAGVGALILVVARLGQVQVKGREGKVDRRMGGRKDVRYNTTRNKMILMTPVISYGCMMYSDRDFSFLVGTSDETRRTFRSGFHLAYDSGRQLGIHLHTNVQSSLTRKLSGVNQQPEMWNNEVRSSNASAERLKSQDCKQGAQAGRSTLWTLPVAISAHPSGKIQSVLEKKQDISALDAM
ncbi:hypothetical protein K438DRAFT_1785521 [Mycena galopus ATCC 62051]|nr:hypothetical protein K438DRAFT_1785521 [Mycena galopus ATCC 62051]